ncbi:hypothetical protein [Paractinoplanes atraurantiacus]|uniref:hypothetical protein n=1 Tax=Paractinoplanes atraurantiacus TaxID=1036182 RepID=UPI0015CF2552|nr:hypothetical protein [Actinoplanes atraurantiacus]
MTRLDWRNTSLSGRKRIALWLHTEVRQGGVFTKQQMRTALSTADKEEQDEQLDRRMRDLRDEGWVISTNREDRSLALKELRLVQEGGAVWQDGYQSRKPKVPTAKERAAIFAADDYACRFCGTSAGDTYPEDALRTAKLTLSMGDSGLVTSCDRCRAGTPEVGTTDDILEAASELTAEEQAVLRHWVFQGRRPKSSLTRVWARYNQLSATERRAFAAELRRR